MIISSIDKSDNQTISHLAQTCTQLWEAAGADALVSFFYTARDRFDLADNSKKIAIFSMLSEWLLKISDQISDETRLKLIEDLSSMASVETKDKNELLRMIKAIEPLFEICKSNVDNIQGSLTDNEMSINDGINLAKKFFPLTQLLNALNKYFESLGSTLRSNSVHLSDILRDFN